MNEIIFGTIWAYTACISNIWKKLHHPIHDELQTSQNTDFKTFTSNTKLTKLFVLFFCCFFWSKFALFCKTHGKSPNTNILINEAFSILIGNMHPLMVLPLKPLSAHSQSHVFIRVKDISSSMFKLSPQMPLTQNFPNMTSTNLSINSAASFFDQKMTPL